MLWYNEGLRRWVVWSPGSDAPPLPGGWASAGTKAEPGGAQRARASSGEAGAGGVAGTASAGTASAGTAGAGTAGAGTAGAPQARGVGRPLPSDAMTRRPSMRSPYRLVPIFMAVLIVAFAVYQATRPPSHATQQDIAAAEALKGKCLGRSGGTTANPTYSVTPVSCSGSSAAVKVVAVRLPKKTVRLPKKGASRLPKKGASCPSGSEVAQLVEPGVRGEPFECLVEVGLLNPAPH
ncbi:MAG: hypothetical protein ACRDZX_16040 [Acidimicrobiales bacterium]